MGGGEEMPTDEGEGERETGYRAMVCVKGDSVCVEGDGVYVKGDGMCEGRWRVC